MTDTPEAELRARKVLAQHTLNGGTSVLIGRDEAVQAMLAFASERPSPVDGEGEVERVARAMCDRVNGQGDFDENIEQRRSGWEAQARVAIAAMSRPSTERQDGLREACIILLSEDHGVQTHGLFASFEDALAHAKKDGAHEAAQWQFSSDHRGVFLDGKVFWTASREPVRARQALASTPPVAQNGLDPALLADAMDELADRTPQPEWANYFRQGAAAIREAEKLSAPSPVSASVAGGEAVERRRGFNAGLDHIANFINALDSSEMSGRDVRSAIYSECLTASTPDSPVTEAGVVEGFVLVPREPTEAMLRAGANAIIDADGTTDIQDDIWSAMLAAAPTIEEERS